jgi:phosphopantetheinyl transferase
MKFLNKKINYLIGSIKDDYPKETPPEFIKNKYSNLEYDLIKKGLLKFYNLKEFQVLYTLTGKPYLDNNIFISITNSQDIVAVAFSYQQVGIDIEHYKKVSPSVKQYLNLPANLSSKKAITEFCKREAIIKLEGKTLRSINQINPKNYKFKIKKNKNYSLVICTTK